MLYCGAVLSHTQTHILFPSQEVFPIGLHTNGEALTL